MFMVDLVINGQYAFNVQVQNNFSHSLTIKWIFFGNLNKLYEFLY